MMVGDSRKYDLARPHEEKEGAVLRLHLAGGIIIVCLEPGDACRAIHRCAGPEPTQAASGRSLIYTG